jgi:hypothetical protein
VITERGANREECLSLNVNKDKNVLNDTNALNELNDENI